MEQLTTQFQQLSIDTNYVDIGPSPFPIPTHTTNPFALEAHKKTVLYSMSKYFYTYEIEQVLAMHRPDDTFVEDIYNDFFEGDIPYHDIIKDDIYYKALHYVESQFKPPQKCRPAHIFDVRYHYNHERSSNAEAPFSTESHYRDQVIHPSPTPKDYAPYSLGTMYNIVFDETRRFHHLIKNGANYKDFLWYIVHHNRYMLTKPEKLSKTRTVSGFPRPQNIAWIQFTWSYLNWMRTRDSRTSPMLWNFETNLGGWLRLNYLLFIDYHSHSIITLDKRTFDKYYFFSIQDDIDTMFESFIEFDNGYLPTVDYPDTASSWSITKGNRLRRLFRWLTYSFRNCPTVFLDGRMYRRKFAGMPSGVYTVQIFDTIYFAITDTDVLLRMGLNLDQITFRKGQGDDIISKIAVCIPPNEHAQFLETYSRIDNARFGSTVSPDKSEIHNTPQGVEVLGYRNNNGLPVRSTTDLLGALYHTKARKPTESITMSVAVGIAYASLLHDPRIYKCCKDIYNYYADQGHTLSQSWLRRTTRWTNLPIATTTSFPTEDEIRANLFDFSFEPRKKTQDSYPRDHFLSDF